MNAKEAKAAVIAILHVANVSYSSKYIGETTRDDKWECDAWLVTIAGQDFEYFTGLGHRKARNARGEPMRCPYPPRTTSAERWEQVNVKPVAPHIADVLHCLLLDSGAGEQSFASWCADFGYSDDSIKARETYDACQRNADKLARILTGERRQQLRDALQDY